MFYNLRGFSKYGNKKVLCYKGHRHDSKLEALRCNELNLLLKGGVIKNLNNQPRFILQEGFKYQNQTIRPIYYIADFSYIDEKGNMVIEDTKGYKTAEYQLKKKLFLKRYNDLVFLEVRR